MSSFKSKFGEKENQEKKKFKNSHEENSQFGEFFFPIIDDVIDRELNRGDYGKTIAEVTEKGSVRVPTAKKNRSSLQITDFEKTPQSNWSKFQNNRDLKPSGTIELKSWNAYQNKPINHNHVKRDIKKPQSVDLDEMNKSFHPLDVPPPMHLINNATTEPIEFELGKVDSKILRRIPRQLRRGYKVEQLPVTNDSNEFKCGIVHDEVETPVLENHTVQDSHFTQRMNAAIAKKAQSSEQINEPVNQSDNNSYAKKYISTKGYALPSIEFLQPRAVKKDDVDWMESQADVLDETFFHFNVNAKVVNCTQGPSVTRFEIQPEPGVKVNKISNLSDDLKLALAARDIRIEAPIPGKSQVGIEIPNRQSRPVFLREVLESEAFKNHPSPLNVAVGLDISGEPVTTDLVKMPHGLVAGSTGSGKSVFINSILISLLYKSSPEDVKLLLIDPKMVELSNYNGIPHLVAPVITDPKAATASLKWAVEEMDRRYELFAAAGVRDIVRYNEKAKVHVQSAVKLPYIVIIIDELADLMMTASQDVEAAICRLAQKARACGMHLIVATQRPSVDVITGLIKSNIATRIAFAVASNIDSRTILDQSGAEKLLGRGDMLFLENGSSKSVRLQGTFVTDDEIEQVVTHIKKQMEPTYLFATEDLLKSQQSQAQSQGYEAELDHLFFEACEFAISSKYISTSSLQRRYRIGYNRAARIIDLMEQHGIISEANGTKPRDVLICEADLEKLKELLDMGNF
jgi:S-DNA-T family DNA segregation ATPase FtsK/SpoIIIE